MAIANHPNIPTADGFNVTLTEPSRRPAAGELAGNKEAPWRLESQQNLAFTSDAKGAQTVVEDGAIFESALCVSPKTIGAKRVRLSNEEWQQCLSSQQFAVLRNSSTEPAGSSRLIHFFPKSGYFACAACSLPLYPTETKFRDDGWPAWDKCFHSKAQGCHVKVTPGCFGEEWLCGAEVVCSCCNGHLGHVFWGEMHTKANQRH